VYVIGECSEQGYRGIVAALRASDGAHLWRSELDLGCPQDTTATGERLYVNTLNTLRVLDAHTGQPLWTAPKGHIVEAGGVAYLVSEIGPGELTAYRASDGQQRWQHQFSPNQRFEGPVVSRGVIFMATTGGCIRGPFSCTDPPLPQGLEALRSADGAPYWQLPDLSRILGKNSAPLFNTDPLYLVGAVL
jgi:outer membrane protein assembly factor BamB